MRRADPLVLSITLPQLTSFAVKSSARQAVSDPPAVELSKRPPPFKLIIDGCQDMNRLVDAADLGTACANLVGRQPGAAHNRSRLNSKAPKFWPSLP